MAERILIVEDDHALRELLVDVVRESGLEPHAVPSAEAALRSLDAGLEPDVVVTDLVLPGRSGAELVRALRATRPDVNTIAITAFGSIESAKELVRGGAFDYLTKPLGTDEFQLAGERALEESRPRRAAARAARSADEGAAPPEFVGTSPVMREVYRLIARAGRSSHPVLITGESGSGKELVARALHRHSGRGAFVPVNCGALPEALLESELFGHAKGAFTGADRAKDGLFRVADGGTLFLDELGELPLALQPKLLRALEQGEVRPVGATQAFATDVRIIAATNRDLESDIRAGRFREDLFWRLNVLTVAMPPLRERPEDIPALAEHFLARALQEGRADAPRRFGAEVLDAFRAYPWPGNVRELRNIAARVATLASGTEVRLEDLPARLRDAQGLEARLAAAARRGLTLREVERMYILEVVRAAGGNRSEAAARLGLDRKTLYRRLEEYRADDPSLVP
jgi:two-component system response regulator HydG